MRRNCRVSSRRRCVHEFATSSRRLPTDSVDNLETGQTDCVCFCVLTTWILINTDNFFNSDDIMTSSLKKLSIFIKIGVIKHYGVCLVSFKIVNRIRRQSSRIVFTPPTPTRRDSTVSSRRRRRCVLGLRLNKHWWRKQFTGLSADSTGYASFNIYYFARPR